MTITLRLIGLLGIVLFGILFSITFVSSKTVEESAKGFVKLKIEQEVNQKINSLKSSSVAEKALSIAEKLGYESEQIQAKLDDNLPEKIASVLASMCGYDCEKKKAVASSIKTDYLDRIKNIKVAQNTLADIVKGKYIEIIGNLKFDLRIFLGTNFVMFLVLLLVSFTKPQAVAHLFLPGILLLISTAISMGIYIFGQDWFYTILYNDYMGFGYLVYIGVIFAVLLDIVFNGAQITTEVINAILNAIGSALSVSPC